MHHEIKYSVALLSQAEDVLAFWAEHAENNARPKDSVELIHALLKRDPDSLIIAEQDGHIVGTVIATWDGWRGNIYRLAVDRRIKKSGIGRALMERAEARLKECGASRVHAVVLEENLEAHGFYERIGYAPQHEWRRWIKNF